MDQPLIIDEHLRWSPKSKSWISTKPRVRENIQTPEEAAEAFKSLSMQRMANYLPASLYGCYWRSDLLRYQQLQELDHDLLTLKISDISLEDGLKILRYFGLILLEEHFSLDEIGNYTPEELLKEKAEACPLSDVDKDRSILYVVWDKRKQCWLADYNYLGREDYLPEPKPIGLIAKFLILSAFHLADKDKDPDFLERLPTLSPTALNALHSKPKPP